MHRSALVAVRGMVRYEASDLSTNGLSAQRWTPPVVARATVASARGRFNGVQGISNEVPTFQRSCNPPSTFPIQRASCAPHAVSLEVRRAHSRNGLDGVTRGSFSLFMALLFLTQRGQARTAWHRRFDRILSQ